MASPEWRTPQTSLLFQAILVLENVEECERFFRDLLTTQEIHRIAQRFHIAKLLSEGLSKKEVEEQTGAARATIDRVETWLKDVGTGGYSLVLERLKTRQEM